MRRRDFTRLLGGAATWPLRAHAQESKTTVIGFLSSLSAADAPRIMAPFRRGLAESGFAEGHNLIIEYRWAEGDFTRLPEMATDLVSRQVSAIAAVSGTPSGLAAKAATATIPIVFAMAADPVEFGLVESLGHPGGNVTGATFYSVLLGAKRLELLREFVPKAITIALFVNPKNPVSVVEQSDVESAALKLGLQAKVFAVTNRNEIDATFQILARERLDALYISADPIFYNYRSEIADLAARHGLPSISGDRDFTPAGGLSSYGASRADAYRQAGVYVGRILKGEKASNLPVVQPTRFELLVNLKTAKALGLVVGPTVLARADEIFE
jgi:putative ABC transport system substrate-binding protein